VEGYPLIRVLGIKLLSRNEEVFQLSITVIGLTMSLKQLKSVRKKAVPKSPQLLDSETVLCNLLHTIHILPLIVAHSSLVSGLFLTLL